MQETNDTAVDIDQEQSTSTTENMDQAAMGEQTNNTTRGTSRPLSFSDFDTLEAFFEAMEIEDNRVLAEMFANHESSMASANAMASQSSDSLATSCSTISSLESLESMESMEATQSQSGNTYQEPSLIRSMLSLIETGVENSRTMLLYQNGEEDAEQSLKSKIPTQNTVLHQNTNLFAYIDDTDDDNTENTIPTQNANAECFLTSFTLFPELPTELRLAIWKLTLPGPRFVEIQNTIAFRDEAKTKINQTITTWHATAIEKAPVAFFICRESRAEVINIYTPLKSTDGNPAILVDFKTDVLCFRSRAYYNNIGDFLDDLPDNRLQMNLTRLLVDEEPHTWGHDYLMYDDIHRLQGLKEIFLTPHVSKRFRNNRIVGFQEGGIKPRTAKRYVSEVEEAFNDIIKDHPGWKRPMLRCGKVTLDSSGNTESES